jgi:Pyruvate/2-oxoacid:ferredoxin oxidoreductase gamma subunit
MVLKKQPYPTFEQLAELYARKTDRVFAVTGAGQPYNMFLLGVFSAVAPEITPELSFFSRERVEKAITEKLKRGLQENLETFKLGYAHGRSLLQQV